MAIIIGLVWGGLIAIIVWGLIELHGYDARFKQREARLKERR
jgi:hypothetical protein